MNYISNIFPFKGFGAVFILEIINTDKCFEGYTDSELNEVKMNLKFWIKDTLKAFGHSLSFFLGGQKCRILTILHADVQFDITCRELTSRLNELILNIRRDYGLDTVISMSNQSENIFSGITYAFKQASRALEHMFYTDTDTDSGTGKIIGYFEIENRTDKITIENTHDHTLADAIRRFDSEKALIIVKNIFAPGSPVRALAPAQFKNYIDNVLKNVVELLQNLLSEEYNKKLTIELKDIVMKCQFIGDMEQVVQNIILEIIRDIKAGKKGKSEKIIQSCISFLDEHYMEDLSIDSIAEMYRFNSNYFSVFFKKNFGVNFSDYILMLRMKKAEELLKENKLKIYEIALLVGYRDVKYFNRVFKKRFGISPDEYRRISSNN